MDDIEGLKKKIESLEKQLDSTLNELEFASVQVRILRDALTGDGSAIPLQGLLECICECVNTKYGIVALLDHNSKIIHEVYVGQEYIGTDLIKNWLNEIVPRVKEEGYLIENSENSIIETIGVSNIGSIACLPLRFMNIANPFGIVCLFRAKEYDKWNDYDVEHLKNAAGAASLRFVQSVPVYPHEFPRIGKLNVAIMFADLRGSTPFTEILMRNERMFYSDGKRKNRPVELAELLNEFFGCLTPEIRQDRNAWIDKSTGDGIEALFVNKLDDNQVKEYAPMRAVCAALQMKKAFGNLLRDWEKDWIPSFQRRWSDELKLDIGIGIDYGPVILDVFGSGNNYQYTAVGNHVNFANRLESMAAKPYGNFGILENILISEPAHQRVEKFVKCKEYRDINLIGVGHRQRIYGVSGWEGNGVEKCQNEIGCNNGSV